MLLATHAFPLPWNKTCSAFDSKTSENKPYFKNHTLSCTCSIAHTWENPTPTRGIWPSHVDISRGPWRLRVRTHWTDKVCLALPNFSTKLVSAKFSICQAWAHWDTAKFLSTTSFNHTEINTIACSLFAGNVTWDLRSHGLTVFFNRLDQIYICCLGTLLPVF